MKLATRSVAAPTRRTALLSTAALALARAPAASAQALARSVEQKIAVVNVDGTTSTTTATRLTGELTGLDLSNRRDITERVFGDAIRADWPEAASCGRDDSREIWGGKTMKHRHRRAW